MEQRASQRTSAVSSRSHRKRFPFASTRDEREALRFDGDAGFLYVLFGIPAKEARGSEINRGRMNEKAWHRLCACMKHEGICTLKSDHDLEQHGLSTIIHQHCTWEWLHSFSTA